MERTKSFFVVIYLGVSSAIGIHAVVQFSSGISFAWAGVILTTLPGVLFIARAMLLKRTARSSARLPLITAQGAIGLGLAGYDYFVVGVAALDTLALAGCGFGLFIAYDYWYSSLRRGPDRLVVGGLLPDFVLQDLDGVDVPSSSMRGHKSLLLFYRGNWCPICMAQIKELAARYRELADRGVKVYLISPQPDGNSIALSKKFEAPMTFLVDPDNLAARRLGIAHRWGTPMGMQILGYKSETVLPTAVIADEDGVIVWADKTDNYRVRPEPDTFLKVLDEMS
jgi:peroxiredoxin